MRNQADQKRIAGAMSSNDVRVFRATEGSTDGSPLRVRVESVVWPRAAKKNGKWYRGFVDAPDGFMARWSMGEA